jgi:hypothetical protein
MASDDRMNDADELESIWKEAWPNRGTIPEFA